MMKAIAILFLAAGLLLAQTTTPVGHVAQPLPDIDPILLLWVPVNDSTPSITGVVLRVAGANGEVYTHYEDKPGVLGNYWTIVVFLPSGFSAQSVYLTLVDLSSTQRVPLQ